MYLQPLTFLFTGVTRRSYTSTEDDHTGDYTYQARFVIERDLLKDKLYFPYVHVVCGNDEEQYHNVYVSGLSIERVIAYVLRIVAETKKRVQEQDLRYNTGIIHTDWSESSAQKTHVRCLRCVPLDETTMYRLIQRYLYDEFDEKSSILVKQYRLEFEANMGPIRSHPSDDNNFKLKYPL